MFSQNTDMKSDIPVIIRKDEINITEFEEVGYSLAYIHSTLVDHAVFDIVQKRCTYFVYTPKGNERR